MTPKERSLRMKITGDIYEAIHKIESKAVQEGNKPNPEFINGMYLAAAIVEERRQSAR